ncbi:baseplate wedge subunit [Cyanophage P-TIM40]|uniref:Baseplate wedge subunit n=1 Tax=Cyanophage P-TIM40 TaxID=1589733 RepID=A0A0C5AMW4_9CAUD|nr:baseplate wedge subunit [Cyanophage P-TIM40]AJK27525.1 baseplate wedge subunit [Cyanophage P-TIM40]
MPAVPSELTSLDFFEIKESIRSYLRTRTEFTDYDFEGSAASYLLDILAYNTYYTAFNANMSLNEAFLETSTVRDNIVKVAKQLNYTPRSIKSPKAFVTVSIQTLVGANGLTYPEQVTINKGDSFSAENNFDDYIFTILNQVQAPVDQSTGIATFKCLAAYQGNLLTYSFIVNNTKKQEYIIPSEDVDTERMIVYVSPSVQSSEIDIYNRATSSVNLDSNSRIYFLEEVDDLRYKVIFGDGVLGRQLVDGEFVKIDYVRTIGKEANGARDFTFIGTAVDSEGRIIGNNNITVVTENQAADGEDRETPVSIKYNAPRLYTTQNRAVTERDFENLVRQIYPQSRSVVAYGGEKLSPPVYGKVYVAVRPKTGSKLNETTKTRIKNELKDYSIGAIDPIIIDPKTLYVIPKSYVYYNGNDTNLSSNDLRTKVLKNVDDYNSNNAANRFNNRFEGSKYAGVVDNADPAISGSTTQFTLGQNLDTFQFGQVFNQCLDFNNPLFRPGDFAGTPEDSNGMGDGGGMGDTCKPTFSVVKSGTFYATGYTESLLNNANLTSGVVQVDTATLSSTEAQTLVPVNLRDDGAGNMMLVTVRDEAEVVLNNNVGSVNYATGEVCVGPLNVALTPDNTNRIPVVVYPSGGSLEPPAGTDPIIFNPEVNPIDYTISDLSVPIFDPNNFNGFNFGGGELNILDYPTDSFTYPELEECF